MKYRCIKNELTKRCGYIQFYLLSAGLLHKFSQDVLYVCVCPCYIEFDFSHSWSPVFYNDDCNGGISNQGRIYVSAQTNQNWQKSEKKPMEAAMLDKIYKSIMLGLCSGQLL